MSPIHCIPGHWPWSSYLLVSMSNCAFVQVRDIKTRKMDKINPSGLCAEFRFRQNISPPSSPFNIYKSRQQRSRRSTTSTSHYLVWSVVTDGLKRVNAEWFETKIEHCRSDWFRSRVGSEHSIQHRFSTKQYEVHTSMVADLCHFVFSLWRGDITKAP